MRFSIIHSHADRHHARALAEQLAELLDAGIQWNDQLVGGEEWWDRTLDQIEDANFVLTILTQRAATSIYWSTQMNHAFALSKPVIVLADEMSPELDRPPNKHTHVCHMSEQDPEEIARQCAATVREIESQFNEGASLLVDVARPTLPKPAHNAPAEAIEVYQVACEAAVAGEYELARTLFELVRDCDPDGFGQNAVAHLEEVRYQSLRAAEYEQIAGIADTPDAGSEWRSFVRKHGHSFDPQGLAEKLEVTSQRIFSTVDCVVDSAIRQWLPAPFTWCHIPEGNTTLLYGHWCKPWGEYFYVVDRQESVQVPAFCIGHYPVTNAQYQAFCDASDGYCQLRWWDYSGDAHLWRRVRGTASDTAFEGDDLPRTNVSWFDAVAFCRWLSWKTGYDIRLPTEEQWQRAARGDDERTYPWGDEKPDGSRANFGGHIGHPTPVTRFESVPSVLGPVDLCGNVWEWTTSAWECSKTDLTGDHIRVLRGGAWNHSIASLRSNVRYRVFSLIGDMHIGFRIVRVFDDGTE